MSAAPTTAAPATADPTSDQAKDRAADQAAHGEPAQPRFGCVLGLLRKLIDYGQDLARSLQQRAAAGTLFTIAVRFGTRDMALILARISRGLRLAQALEQRLIRRPLRPDTAPAPLRAPADRPSRPPRRAVPRPPLPDMPTAEEIAAALRHRPAAAVIGDICRDLGIVPSHPLWQEVMVMLSGHGGNFMKLLNDFIERLRTSRADPSDDEAEGWPAPGSQLATPCGTGPP